MNNKRIIMITLVGVAILLILSIGLVSAQAPPLKEYLEPQAVRAKVFGDIPIQGQLTDAGGNPLDGTYDMTFRLYTDFIGGSALCEDTDSVDVNGGLFNSAIGNCTSSDINGQQLYLGIQVESDPEMVPRQPILPVPYAISLRPGAIISGTESSAVFEASNYGEGLGILGRNISPSPDAAGVEGTSLGGSGVLGASLAGVGIEGDSFTGVSIKASGTGVIQSAAQSYLWISGNSFIKANSDDTTEFGRDLYGGYKITGGSGFAIPKVVVLPITIPGQVYGQNVTLTDLDLYYTVSADLTGIRNTNMRRQDGVGAGDLIFTDGTDLSCVPGNQCEKHWDLTQNNVLSDLQGILYLAFELGFPDDTANVQIGGVRLTLAHD